MHINQAEEEADSNFTLQWHGGRFFSLESEQRDHCGCHVLSKHIPFPSPFCPHSCSLLLALEPSSFKLPSSSSSSFFDSWERSRYPAALTCPLSELCGVEIVATSISYVVMSLLPCLPVPGKDWRRQEVGILLASKVEVSMQEQGKFFWRKWIPVNQPRQHWELGLGLPGSRDRLSCQHLHLGVSWPWKQTWFVLYLFNQTWKK